MSTLSPETKQKRLDDLYEYGKAKGMLTYKEIMDRLMELEMDSDQLDHVLETLDAYGVSVVNDTSGWVDCGVDDRVVFSIRLVVIIDDLYAEQLCYENGRCCTEADEKLVFSVEFHGCLLLFLFLSGEDIHYNESENHIGGKRSSETAGREPEWSGACSVKEYIHAQE